MFRGSSLYRKNSWNRVCHRQIHAKLVLVATEFQYDYMYFAYKEIRMNQKMNQSKHRGEEEFEDGLREILNAGPDIRRGGAETQPLPQRDPTPVLLTSKASPRRKRGMVELLVRILAALVVVALVAQFAVQIAGR